MPPFCGSAANLPPAGGIGVRGFPCKRAKCTFALCLRKTPALQGGRFTAGGKSIPWLKLAYMKILPTLHKAEVTILEQLVVKHHVRI